MSPAEAALYVRLPVYQRRVAEATTHIVEGLRVAPTAYVAMSCGKDSSVLLHLVQAVAPGTPARFLRWTESGLLDDYDRVLAWWAAQGVAIDVVDVHRASIDETRADRWTALEGDASGVLIGLRAQESPGRAMGLRTFGPRHPRVDGRWRIAPLAWWTTRDIAAYTVTHGLPLLDAYQADGLDTRTSARVPRRQVRQQALQALRRRDPGRWNALAAAYPEVLRDA